MLFRQQLVRLAHTNPELREALLPLLRKHASSCEKVQGGSRKSFEEEVWGMFVSTYKKIGLILSSPNQLYKYSVWELCLGKGREPFSFNLFKETPFGLKSGLSGSDGSSDGRRAIIDGIRSKFKQPGIFGEVSHKVEAITLAAGSPVVCAAYVPRVLKKEVQPEADGLHYSRSLAGVGKVIKIMVGNPKGVPTTTISDPSCPVALAASQVIATEDDFADLGAHYSCLSC